MKSVSLILGEYAAYHRHPLNRMTHYFGIPLIVFSLLLILSIQKTNIADLNFSIASVLTLLLIAWYLKLDLQLGLISAVFLIPMLWLAGLVTDTLSGMLVNIIFAITFLAGWILQLLGHQIEKRRPALVDNFLQVFSAPLFLVSELVFAMGMRPALSIKVEVIARQQHDILNRTDNTDPAER